MHVDADLHITKDSQVADAKISAIGINDAVSHVEIKNYNTFIFTLAKKGKYSYFLQMILLRCLQYFTILL